MHRLLVLASILLALSGCSTIRIVYNQADHITAWMADDYFDLTSDQKQAYRTHFERFHAWHRSTQLADYAALLESAQRRIEAGATSADADWFTEALQARLKTMVQHAYKDAAHLLSQVSDEQLQATRREFEKRNRKYAKENGVGEPADEQRRLRARRQIERIEHWTGPLDSAQEARLREMSRALPLITEQRYQERLRRQNEFLALLQQRRQTETFAPRLRDWLLDWDKTRSPAYQLQYTQFMQGSARMYVASLQTLTQEQRQHVISVLQRYQQTFRDLAAQSQRGAAAHP
jgi:hypothetical protein